MTTMCPWIFINFVWKWKWSRSVVSDSLRPHGRSPTRLRRPWDFPGKNTGVGCHFLLQGIFPTQGSNPGLLHCRQTLYRLSHQGSPLGAFGSRFSLVQLCATLWTVPARLLCPWDSPGKNTGVSCHVLLQGIFPTQGSNPGLLHCRQTLYRLSHQGSPRRVVDTQ